MRLDRTIKITLVLLALLAATAVSPASAQEFKDPPSPAEEPGTFDLPDRSDLGNVVQTAATFYHSGVRRMKSARKLEEKLADTPENKRAKMEKKIRSAYEGASQDFIQAIQNDSSMLEAYAELGTVMRALGKPDGALKVHASALKNSPDDSANFQGWADSLLALNMLGDATVAYSQMETTRPDRAAQLMEAMKRWLSQKRLDPGDLDPAHIERLEQWIQDQEAS
ncbi:MAG: tetratricopeptide repeat protein [Thermoanaerobaculia bacterium]